MILQGVGKPAGCKLIRFTAEVEGSIIKTIQIRGDFLPSRKRPSRNWRWSSGEPPSLIWLAVLLNWWRPSTSNCRELPETALQSYFRRPLKGPQRTSI